MSKVVVFSSGQMTDIAVSAILATWAPLLIDSVVQGWRYSAPMRRAGRWQGRRPGWLGRDARRRPPCRPPGRSALGPGSCCTHRPPEILTDTESSSHNGRQRGRRLPVSVCEFGMCSPEHTNAGLGVRAWRRRNQPSDPTTGAATAVNDQVSRRYGTGQPLDVRRPTRWPPADLPAGRGCSCRSGCGVSLCRRPFETASP